MNDLLFTINVILPIIIPILIGYIFKKTKLLSTSFFKEANKIVFRFFLPLLLFNNLYLSDLSNIDYSFILYLVLSLIGLFLMGFIPTLLIKDKKKKGVFHAATFRTNYAFIGIPLAIMLLGGDNQTLSSLVAAFVLPLLNILGTIVLSIYDKENGEKVSIKKVILNIITNPIIIGVLCGVIFSLVKTLLNNNGIDFNLDKDTHFLAKSINMISSIATPFALIALGGQIEFKAVKTMWKEVLLATIFRLIVSPLLTLPLGYFLGFTSPSYFAVMISLFASPISVVSATMASELKQDEEYAIQILLWNTICSAISLFVIIFICRSIGIF